MKINEDVAATFITRNLSERGLIAFLADEKFGPFLELVGAGKDMAAAEGYKRVTGARVPECHLAVVVASRPTTAKELSTDPEK